jgi:tetratricopeptide (TPR) repeat protein
MSDFNKIADLVPTKPYLYLERAKYFQRKKKFSEAISDYSRVIEIEPKCADIYLERARCYHQKIMYSEAISDYSKAIELNPDCSEIYFIERADCYAQHDKVDEALSDYNRSIEIKPSSDAYLGRGKIYSGNDLNKALEDFTRAIELNCDDWETYFLRGKIYEKQGNYELAEQDYSKSIEIWPDNGDAYFQRAELYKNHMSKWKSAIADYKYAVYNSGTLSYSTHDVYNEIIELSESLAKDAEYQRNQAEKLQYQLDIKKVREEEQKKILADLSHSIKNLISTVIDPLENLKHESSVKPQVIENALKGANLIRKIVNAMNLSFKGSINDFRYDATHYIDAESQDLKSILIEALKHSVGNMFDGKYFGTFTREYFPEKSLYLAAKEEWSTLSQSNDLTELLPFLRQYFFRTDFVLDNAEQLIISNQKGSIIKLLILCQELILNAVKYSAFIDKESRFLRVHFDASDQFVSILVENSFDKKSKVKTSGIGHIIIQNFAKLLDTVPTTKNDEGIYSVEIRFANIWMEAKA